MKKAVYIILPILAIVSYCFLEVVLRPPYFLKSLLKIIIFLLAVVAYCIINKKKFSSFFKFNKIKHLRNLIIFSFVSYIGILFLYYCVSPLIPLDVIKENLMTNENITKDNFILVYGYIIFVNSFLEEIFYRGLAFVEYRSIFGTKFAYIFSSLLFSLYHISIISSWFNPFIFVLIIALLFVAGLILDYITEKCNSYIAAWIIHMTANMSINTIGVLIMLG